MEPVTHTLAALMLARAGALRPSPGQAARPDPRATLTLVLAANAPELDYLSVLGGTSIYFDYHRTWGHSLAGGVLLGTWVALAVQRLARGEHRPLAVKALLAPAWLGAGSHLLLDCTTAAGTAWLWPVKAPRYALDWFAFIDPLLLVVLVLGLALPALFRLIAEEIGARRDERGKRRGAWVALAVCLLLAAGRGTLHNAATQRLQSRLYADRTPLRTAALPDPLNPFLWSGFVETGTTYETGGVRLAGETGPAERFSTHFKPSSSPALERALATDTARRFLARARFSYIEVIPAPEAGWRIHIQDLADLSGRRPRRSFTAWIDLSRGLQVQRETLFAGRSGEEPPR